MKRKINHIQPGSVIRLGGMTDCFQPCELKHRVTYQTILEMNRCRVGYLIVTKSAIIAEPEYMDILDRKLAHIQITVTCLDDAKASQYEKSSLPSQRIRAIQRLQEAGFDVSIRLSPIIESFMDFEKLNTLGIEKCIIEFLRINPWIKQWLKDVNFDRYTLPQGGYRHLTLTEKIKIIDRIQVPEKTVCEDVTEHYLYWKEHVNPNKEDCCNLRF